MYCFALPHLKNYRDADSLVEGVVFISQKQVGGPDKY